ncbi:MAG: M48 family metallopeptidase [Clostridia bacterium]|nr:M48 family metallopeptidase [Clostridia bacterium]
MEKVVFVRSRRKTMSLTVDREGQVIVRMPYGMPQSRAIDFLELNRNWVTRQIAAKSKRMDIRDGAEVSVFGERVTIRNGKAERKGNELFLPEKEREEALAKYTISLAKTYMRDLTEEIAMRYGFVYSSVRISRARGRWGSCSVKGNITYSFRIAFLPLPVIRAVAVHELCHTRHMNHSAAFWQEVQKIVPNYAMVRKELKKYEFLMNSL